MIVEYEEIGFAALIGQLLEQKAKNKEAEIKGTLVIHLRDMNVYATLEFAGNRVKVRNGKANGKHALISTDFQTLNELMTASTIKVLEFMLTRKLKIKGIGLANKFSQLLK